MKSVHRTTAIGFDIQRAATDSSNHSITSQLTTRVNMLWKMLGNFYFPPVTASQFNFRNFHGGGGGFYYLPYGWSGSLSVQKSNPRKQQVHSSREMEMRGKKNAVR